MMRRLPTDDKGTTLVELLVVMVLLGIVSSVALTAFVAASKALHRTDDEATGLADVRKVSERLGRDVRDARSVASGASASQLVLWVDYNSDYRQTTAETITWKLRTGAKAGQYDVVRQEGTGVEVVEANTLVSNLAFSYDLVAPKTRAVTTAMTYDAYIGNGAKQRTVNFVNRLRNADSE